jgi:glycosyltransferase involved in cell wall biosynthesis
MPEPFRYRRIFTYGSSQFCGHIEAYWAAHTEDLLVYVVEPRIARHQNVMRIYHRGHQVSEYRVRSSQTIIGYYAWWYLNHLIALLRFSHHPGRTYVVGSHPIAFLGMSLIKWLRPVVYAYWIGDYFPSTDFVCRCFERVKKWYHDRVTYTFYLSDAIHRVMNGKVVDTPSRRTVMWGLRPYPAMPVPPLSPFHLLFVGLIRPGQGLETLFHFLEQHNEYRLSLIGVGQASYVSEIQSLLLRSGLTDRVFFPNRFYSEADLLAVARQSHVGIALYDTSADNFTHYADPGKVKAYAEMHLPVVMTRVSGIVPYVERFGSGEVIGDAGELQMALEKIRRDYPRYQAGLRRFIAYFEHERYYRDAFAVLEDH